MIVRLMTEAARILIRGAYEAGMTDPGGASKDAWVDGVVEAMLAEQAAMDNGKPAPAQKTGDG